MRLIAPPRTTPTATGELLGEISVPGAAVSVVAPWLAATLRDCTPGAVHEAATLVSELLGNAGRHAEPPYRARIYTVAGANSVRLEVDDASHVPEPPWPAGKGLLIVRGLCEEWGVFARVGGKTMWAVLPLLVGPGSQAGGAPVRVES